MINIESYDKRQGKIIQHQGLQSIKFIISHNDLFIGWGTKYTTYFEDQTKNAILHIHRDSLLDMRTRGSPFAALSINFEGSSLFVFMTLRSNDGSSRPGLVFGQFLLPRCSDGDRSHIDGEEFVGRCCAVRGHLQVQDFPRERKRALRRAAICCVLVNVGRHGFTTALEVQKYATFFRESVHRS